MAKVKGNPSIITGLTGAIGGLVYHTDPNGKTYVQRLGEQTQEKSEAQLAYAASDVLHLHGLREKLDMMLAREGRTELALECFKFLPARAKLDLAGWPELDIFAH